MLQNRILMVFFEPLYLWCTCTLVNFTYIILTKWKTANALIKSNFNFTHYGHKPIQTVCFQKTINISYIPLCSSFSFDLMVLKSGLFSGSCAQHSLMTSVTNLGVVSSSASRGRNTSCLGSLTRAIISKIKVYIYK